MNPQSRLHYGLKRLLSSKTRPLKFRRTPQNEELNRRAEIVNHIAKRLREHEVNATLVVCGSLAKGSAHKDSDIDLLLISKTEFCTLKHIERLHAELNSNHMDANKKFLQDPYLPHFQPKDTSKAELEIDRIDQFLKVLGDPGISPEMKLALGYNNIYKTKFVLSGIPVDVWVMDENIIKDALYIKFRPFYNSMTDSPTANILTHMKDWFNNKYTYDNSFFVDVYKKNSSSKYDKGMELLTPFGEISFDSRLRKIEKRMKIVDRTKYANWIRGRIRDRKARMNELFHFKHETRCREAVVIDTKERFYAIRNFPSTAILDALTTGKVAYEDIEYGQGFQDRVLSKILKNMKRNEIILTSLNGKAPDTQLATKEIVDRMVKYLYGHERISEGRREELRLELKRIDLLQELYIQGSPIKKLRMSLYYLADYAVFLLKRLTNRH